MTSQQKRRFSFYIESSVDSPPCSPAGTFSPKRVKGFSGMEPGRCQHIYISIIHTYNIYTKICDIIYIYILYIYIHVIVILGMDHQPAFSCCNFHGTGTNSWRASARTACPEVARPRAQRPISPAVRWIQQRDPVTRMR